MFYYIPTRFLAKISALSICRIQLVGKFFRIILVPRVEHIGKREYRV